MNVIADLHIGDEVLKNICLIKIERLLNLNCRSLEDYDTMPTPVMSVANDYENRFIAAELSYNQDEMTRLHSSMITSLTAEQRDVYDRIIASVVSDSGGFFFLYGYGGTGKTFLWKTLSAAIRAQGLIVLNVASSGIASLLLPRGRTTHSTFAIALLIKEDSTCNITVGTPKANLLLHTKLIIWDEAPMMNRFCFEALDKTLRDVMGSVNKDNKTNPFGGKVVVL